MTLQGSAVLAMAGSAAENLRVRGVTIMPDVADVLRRSTTDGNVLRLPEGQLDRSLYTAVDKALRALGGKWNRSQGGHVFDRDIGAELAASLAGGMAVDRKKTSEQFFTPQPVAMQMWEAIDLDEDDHVLEPSAGMGALLANPIRVGCFITAVEADGILAKGLTNLLAGMHGCGIWHADFMAWQPVARVPITAVLMNPPFSGGRDVDHVLRAWTFLAAGGRMAAIMGEHAFIAADRKSIAFREWFASVGADDIPLPSGAFKESGTMVSSRLVVATKR